MTPHIGRRALLIMASQTLGAALGYVALLVVGRYIEADAYGAYLLAFSWIGLLAFLSTMGVGQAHQREVSTGTDVGRALGVFVRMRALMAIAVAALTAAAYLAWRWSGGRLTDATTSAVLLVAVAIHAVNAVRYVALETWLAQAKVQRVEAAKLVDSAVSVTLIAFGGTVLAHLQGRWSPLPGVGAAVADALDLTRPPGIEGAALFLAYCYLAGKIASCVPVAWWWLGDKWRVGRWDRELAGVYWRYAMPVALTTVIGLVLMYTDITMLGYFWSAHEVGLYGAAQKLSSLSGVLAVAVSVLLFPRFAALHRQGDMQGIRSTLRTSERYLLMAVLPPAVALMALPAPILHVAVGDRYSGAADALRVLGAYAVIATINVPSMALLTAQARLRATVKASALNAGLNVILLLILVPRAGAAAAPASAAVATLASSAAAFVYLRWAIARSDGLRLDGWSTLRMGAAAVALWAAWRFGAGHVGLPIERVYGLVAVLLLGCAFFLLALWASGELKARDLRLARDVLRPVDFVREFRRG